jgi:hypothetical protein
MRLEDQVCTLVQAKKLKELGVVQSALFSWCGDENHYVNDKQWVFVSDTEPKNNQEGEHRSMVPSLYPFAAAYNVAELGILIAIPKRLGKPNGYSIAYRWDQWIITKDDETFLDQTFKFEAHARAELLLLFLKEEIIMVEFVNQTLSA